MSNDEDNEFEEDNTQELVGEGDKSFVETIFNVEGRIELVTRSWRGEVPIKTNQGIKWVKKNRELAGDRFINKTSGAMRVIINESNIITRKTDRECRKILYDANRAFIFDLVNEPTIKSSDYRTLAKSFEHNIELFLGLVEFGHGSRVAVNISTGVNSQTTETKSKGMFGGLFSGLGVNNK